MKYTSTRNSNISYSFEDAICSGYAPDGGLFVPRSLPKLDPETLKSWSSLSFPQLAYEVIRRFVATDEISNVDLKKICHDSFVKGFDGDNEEEEEVIPVKKIGSAYMVELFHGPTFCFKDLGMRAVINTLSYFATKRQKNITLIVSTTGDTGPAAVQAVSDAENPLLNILVHYPLGQISAFQRKQLTTANSPYVRVATFEGGGDDMDAPIKRMLTSPLTKSNENDKDPKDNNKHLCGVNSYNIGRPLVQMVHFVVKSIGIKPGDKDNLVDIILPTGAMGNIAGGFMAKKMGVPIGKLCAGVNINDISHRVIESGKFHKSAKMKKTLSDAINIQVPYNFERLLYYLTDENHNLVHQWMTTMEATAKLDLDSSWHHKLQTEFSSARITDDEMCSSMRKVYTEFNYLIDPHTAVAVATANKLGYDMYSSQNDSNKVDSRPFAILSTASPCKFEESVTIGVGETIWKRYFELDFPTRAASILQKVEVEPMLYTWKHNSSLEEVQVEWEKLARNIIAEF